MDPILKRFICIIYLVCGSAFKVSSAGPNFAYRIHWNHGEASPMAVISAFFGHPSSCVISSFSHFRYSIFALMYFFKSFVSFMGFMPHALYQAKSLSWNRGVPMASRRGQILLAVFLLDARFALAACHCFNSGAVLTQGLCLECLDLFCFSCFTLVQRIKRENSLCLFLGFLSIFFLGHYLCTQIPVINSGYQMWHCAVIVSVRWNRNQYDR